MSAADNNNPVADRLEPLEFTTQVTLTEEQVASLLCAAWEGGSAYWATSNDRNLPYKWDEVDGHMGRLYLNLPVKVTSTDDAGKATTYVLGIGRIENGLELLGSTEVGRRHLANILTGDDDAETGDVFLQLCLFGEVVYG